MNTNQLKVGALLSYLSIFITLIISLTYTPVMIRLLGQAEYGLYSLIGSISAYLSIMDMGLGNAIVRYTARNRTFGDKHLESKMNGMFLILYFLIGIFTIIIGLIIYNNVENIFDSNFSRSEIDKTKIMVIIQVVNFAISFPLSVFGSIIQAYERFVFIKILSIVRHLLIPIFTLPVLFLGHGSVEMVLVISIINIFTLLINVFYCFKNLKVTFYFGKVDLPLLKEVLGYSFFVFLGIIVDRIYWSTGQVILGVFSGTISVAIYAIAMKIIQIYMQFSTSINGLLLPKASIMIANNVSNKNLTDFLIKTGRIQYIVLAYIFGGFILIGKPFISLWAGENYESAYYIILIIMIPLTIPLIQNFAIQILYAKNLQGFRSVVLIIIAIINIIISIPLTKEFGGIGTAIATSLSLFLGNSLIMNIYYQKKIGLNIIVFWKNILFLTIPISLSLVVGLILNVILTEKNVLTLIVINVSFSLSYLFFLWKIGFNKYEKQLFNSIAQRILIKFKKVDKSGMRINGKKY